MDYCDIEWFALETNRDHSVAFEIPFKYCKDKSEKVGLKFNIQKTKTMASGLITSWEIDGETVETVSDFIYLFIFLVSKITADGDCNHEIKRCLLLGRKLWPNNIAY